MSSFIRTIQRTTKRRPNKAGKGIGVHFNLRGSKLGTKNPKDPCCVRSAKKAPKAWRDPRKLEPAARVVRRSVLRALRLTKADRKAEHRIKMEMKAIARAKSEYLKS